MIADDRGDENKDKKEKGLRSDEDHRVQKGTFVHDKSDR